jgi:hypothetical protein
MIRNVHIVLVVAVHLLLRDLQRDLQRDVLIMIKRRVGGMEERGEEGI